MKKAKLVSVSEKKKNYNDALESFIEEVKQDDYIIAAFLFGSLVHDDVWEKSDIDITLITKDQQTNEMDYWLMSDFIDRPIQVTVYSRNQYKRMVEKSLHSSSVFHVIGTSKILFSKDETLREYFEEALTLGQRDIELQLLSIITMIIGDLEKAEKFLYYKKDLAQSYLFVLRLLDRLAQVVVLLNDEVPRREVIAQAMKYEADIFNTIYNNVILETIDVNKLEEILEIIRGYLILKTPTIFKPVLTYLKQAGEVRSNSDIVYHLNKLMPSDWWKIAIDCIGQWLTDNDYLYKVPCPIRLTKRSKIQMNETGYYYVGDDDK
ncbi:MAG: nucleotidyltransferase domain-containing protein [Candidatus Kariarchaeaceae archaeon]|jgi:predicted nucleotidyltransferase